MNITSNMNNIINNIPNIEDLNDGAKDNTTSKINSNSNELQRLKVNNNYYILYNPKIYLYFLY